MTDINELRRVLFVDPETSICRPPDEYISGEAQEQVKGKCSKYDDHKGLVTDEYCVEMISSWLRMMCSTPSLLGSTFLNGGKISGAWAHELQGTLEALYESTKYREMNKWLKSIKELRKYCMVGKCELRKDVAIPEKFKTAIVLFLDKSISNDKLGVIFGAFGAQQTPPEFLNEFYEWMKTNLIFTLVR